MNTEQRLLDAFRSAERVRPSDDLWSRVVHSIDEDRAHRRRVVLTAAAVLATLGALIGIGYSFRREYVIRDFVVGHYVERRVFDALVTIALVALVVALGPAVRRFGRGYAHDLWPSAPTTARAIVRLLDVAYALVFVGYILLTERYGYPTPNNDTWSDQVGDASIRIGGLLLVMGVLHTVTFMVLPFVAMVDNTTRRGRRLPRWLTVLGAVVLLTQVVPAFPALAIFFVELVS